MGNAYVEGKIGLTECVARTYDRIVISSRLYQDGTPADKELATLAKRYAIEYV